MQGYKQNLKLQDRDVWFNVQDETDGPTPSNIFQDQDETPTIMYQDASRPRQQP
jgi:hypothetical protein